jgi:hypothetical protein
VNLVLLAASVSFLFVSGCVFDRGSASVLTGTVNQALECDPTPRADGCPPCSTASGARCSDRWYASGMRCSGDTQCGGSGTCQRGFCVFKDQDADGIDDDLEREVAERNFPNVQLDVNELCGGPHGVLYHVRRHPANPARLAITYTVLYGIDCGGISGHVGDAESFAITVDLDAQPGAAATVGVMALAHAGTSCASTSSCETAAATGECATPPGTSASSLVTIYSSQNKHANYLSTSTCDDNCFDQCNPGQRLLGPLVDVGEPDHPLVTDLTTQAFVQSASGWADELLHFNPWSSAQFSGGGNLARPLGTLLAPPGK